MVFETLVCSPLNHLTRLIARENFIIVTILLDRINLDPVYLYIRWKIGVLVFDSWGAGNFSLLHRVQNGSGAHPVSYPMGTRGSFPGGKMVGT
jgi:hypothetical protein